MKKPKKYLTFSYDDGTAQDARLVNLLNRYGIKATFNLNSGLLGQPGSLLREGQRISHDKIDPALVRSLYAGHEIAGHTLTHPLLTELSDEEVVRQVEEDRQRLSELAGYEVVGFAYPCGGINYDRRVADLIRTRTGVRYARIIQCNGSFAPQSDLYTFRPTTHHTCWEQLEDLGKRFLEEEPEDVRIFYIWGHAFELDIHDSWDRLENFLQMMAGRPDIAYVTNREVLLSSQ